MSEEACMATPTPWSDLLPALLDAIAKKLLVNLVDYVRFRAVCKPWRSAALDPRRLNFPLPSQLPWLMLNFDECCDLRSFYRLSDGKIIDFWLPEVRGCRIVGCAVDGWLTLVDETLAVRLFNPLTKAQIHLPSLTTLSSFIKCRKEVQDNDYEVSEERHEFVFESEYGRYTSSSTQLRDLLFSKVILASSSPTLPIDGVVVANAERIPRVLFARPGDEQWMVSEKLDMVCTDFLHFRGTTYAVDRDGTLLVCDIGPPTSLTPILRAPKKARKAYRWYMVECGQELLMVARYTTHKPRPFGSSYSTDKFEVFKVTGLDGMPRMGRVKSLGNRVLFLGTNRSMSLAARDLPGGRPNCIYFTACLFEIFYGGHHGSNDFGMFDLEHGSVESLPCYFDNTKVVWPPLIWFTPSLCFPVNFSLA